MDTIYIYICIKIRYDPVLKEIYNYYSPTYNFEFVDDILNIFINILNCGQINNNTNIFINQFNIEILDRLSDVVIKISSSKGIKKWKTFEGKTIDNKILLIIQQIASEHKRCNTKEASEIERISTETINAFKKSITMNTQSSWNVSSNWDTIPKLNRQNSWSDYQKLQAQSKIRIKCLIQYKNTAKQQMVIFDNIDKSISFGNLHYRISSAINGLPVKLFYVSNLNEQIFIRDNISLKTCISRCKFNEIELLAEPFEINKNNVNRNDSNDIPMSPKDKRNEYSDNPYINNIATQYGLSTNIISKLWDEFRSHANNNGNINRNAFQSVMKNIGCNDDAQIEMLFQAFDHDKSGLLDFRGFDIYMSMHICICIYVVIY